MSELRLRVGGRYQSQRGPVVEISHRDSDGDFRGKRNGIWKENGEPFFRNHDTDKTYGPLISEITSEQENKMETFFALITKVHDNGSARSCVGRILELHTSTLHGEWVSLQMEGKGGCGFDTKWRWNQKDFGHFERLPTLTRAAFNAHWGIKEEAKPKELPPAVLSALEKGDFGCRRDSVRDLSQALIQYFESRMEEGKK